MEARSTEDRLILTMPSHAIRSRKAQSLVRNLSRRWKSSEEEEKKMEAEPEPDAAMKDGEVRDGGEDLDEIVGEDDGSAFDYIHVFENVGTKIYKYFHPREIFRMSLANSRIFKHVSQHLIRVFQQNLQLPFTIDLGPRSLPLENDFQEILRRWSRLNPRARATFIAGDLYPTRERLVDHVLRTVLAGSELRAIIASDAREHQTQEGSINFARERLNEGCTVRLELPDRDGSVRLQPTHGHPSRGQIAETAGARDAPTDDVWEGLIACHHSELDRRDAKRVVDRYFRGGRGSYRSFARSWLRYILSQPDASARHVRYVFVHPNDIESIVAEGLVIANSEVGGGITVRFKTQL